MTNGMKALVALAATVWAIFLGLLVWESLDGFGRLGRWAAAVESPESGKAPPAQRAAAVKKKLEALKPRGTYIVIDTGANRLWLKNGDTVIREAVVSCGSGGILKDPSGQRTWVFDTPRGQFTVKSKITNPYWVKPDWAFIEEGEPIPENLEDRVEAGTLGDYAVGFGSGYFIHGTLYTRLLGRNVTHGCVRAGDEDLKFLFKNVPVGARIFIY
jgi:lipoprotein-anchoring transpeptidase ErfK/SrfK